LASAFADTTSTFAKATADKTADRVAVGSEILGINGGETDENDKFDKVRDKVFPEPRTLTPEFIEHHEY
jgi:hypothetical protein